MGISDGLSGLKDEGQAEVGDAGRHVGLDQDVFTLEVAMGDGRFHLLNEILLQRFCFQKSVMSCFLITTNQ